MSKAVNFAVVQSYFSTDLPFRGAAPARNTCIWITGQAQKLTQAFVSFLP